MRFLLLLLTLSNAMRTRADEPLYSFDKIPKDLLSNADAVVRAHDLKLEIMAPGEVRETERLVVTILNEQGDGYSRYATFSDKFSYIDDFSGSVYDKDGIEVKSLKKKDIAEGFAGNEETFLADQKYRVATFGYRAYPYTCVFEISKIYRTSLFLPEWRPVYDTRCALGHATLEVTCPKSLSLSYKAYGINGSVIKKDSGDVTILRCTESNVEAVKYADKYMAAEAPEFPMIQLSVDRFEIADFNGKMANWAELGKFMYDLNAGRDKLPENIRSIVHKLSDTCQSPYGKIAILYNYLQNNTRYVSIQLGIGGWQTFDAGFVAEKGYGDCKALSNYMKALLAEAGIKAFAAVVNGGENYHMPVDEKFCANYFSHVILCVPLSTNKDTIWLECTAKGLPAGYLSGFTAGKHALLFTPEGGRLVKTPVYGMADNRLMRAVAMTMDSEQSVAGKASFKYEGSYRDNEYDYMQKNTQQVAEEHLGGLFNMASCRVGDYISSVNVTPGHIPLMDENFSIAGAMNANTSGKRMFLSPDILPLPVKPVENDIRSSPFTVKGYSVSDSVVISLPAKYSAEHVPDMVDIQKTFGGFQYTVKLEDSTTIKIISTYWQKEGTYAADIFADYATFTRKVSSAVADKIVLLKVD